MVCIGIHLRENVSTLLWKSIDEKLLHPDLTCQTFLCFVIDKSLAVHGL